MNMDWTPQKCDNALSILNDFPDTDSGKCCDFKRSIFVLNCFAERLFPVPGEVWMSN